MFAYFLSPAGRIGRRAYAAPIVAFFALAAISAAATGATLTASSIGYALDNPWASIGRGLDNSVLLTLPVWIAAPLAITLFCAAAWALVALTIKRLHDLGRSGWWSVLVLLPGVSFILMMICALVPGRQVAEA